MGKGKCGWCGLKFDMIKYKPAVELDNGEELCEKCAKKSEN